MKIPNSKDTLVIGRCWKFLDFLVPSLDGITRHNSVDIIIIDSLSSRSETIASYCRNLLKNKDILGFIKSDHNYLGNVWHVNQYLVDIFEKYKYICLTDFDLRIINPRRNWIGSLTNILEMNQSIGAVSGDFEPMPPISDHFVFAKDHPELKLPECDFWNMITDGWFYTVRSSEFVSYLKSGGRNNQFGPGMHGYNSYCYENQKMIGRTNLIFYHYGWLRYTEEWNAAYKESGIDFNINTENENNQSFLALQGNWENKVRIPNEKSFVMEM